MAPGAGPATRSREPSRPSRTGSPDVSPTKKEAAPAPAASATPAQSPSESTPDTHAPSAVHPDDLASRQPPFRPLTLALDTAREVLRAMPETSAFAAEFRLHTAKNLLSALTTAGRSSQSLAPWQAATPALAWSPLPGEDLVIMSGDGPTGAALIAYYPTPKGPRFAGSFTTKDEHAPILVAYKSDTRDELLYSTCWGCGGEGGALRLDETRRPRFMPR